MGGGNAQVRAACGRHVVPAEPDAPWRQKTAMSRARNQAKLDTANKGTVRLPAASAGPWLTLLGVCAGSQLKQNEAALSIKCKVCLQPFICTSAEVKLREHRRVCGGGVA